MCADGPYVCVNRFRCPCHKHRHPWHPQALQQPQGHPRSRPQCPQPLRLTAAPGRAVPRAAGPSCACPGRVTATPVGVGGAGEWSGHRPGPSWLGKLWPAAMSSICSHCIPSTQLRSRGAVMVLAVLFAASPRPLSPPHSLGVQHSTEGHGDRQWQNPLIAATLPKALASELSLPPTGGQNLSRPGAWCDTEAANGTGQPSSHLPAAPWCPKG